MKKFCTFCAKAVLLCLLAFFVSCSGGGSSGSDESENGVLIQAEKSKSADGGVLLKISNLPKVENSVRILYEDGSDDLIYHNGNASDDYELEYPFVEAGQSYKFYVVTKVNGNEIPSSKAAIVPDSGVGEFRLKEPIKVDYSDNCIKVTRGEFKGQIESKFSPKCQIQLWGDAEWNEGLGEYETDNLDLSKVYGISQKDVYYFILYSINYNNKMIRSYHNCNNNGCVKVDTSGVTYKYEYDSSACSSYSDESLNNGWSIEGYKIPTGMNPKSSDQSENGISFSIDKNVMREYYSRGYYSTKSVKFKKAFIDYTSVKSLKAKVRGTSGNWFVMGISYQYPDDDKTGYGWSFHKICTGSETEFEILTPASGIKNLQVYFEPCDKGSYEVSDIQIE
ncbi:hypothetical protein [uncultured Treponema sp.]|uniref:hypothetical protein n=1 Tax=uncultured Treponema sp. TaxID=162155 RepID=UPI0025F738D7|nr:hypothetical protein [uncultured Treponema sp.]